MEDQRDDQQNSSESEDLEASNSISTKMRNILISEIRSMCEELKAIFNKESFAMKSEFQSCASITPNTSQVKERGDRSAESEEDLVEEKFEVDQEKDDEEEDDEIDEQDDQSVVSEERVDEKNEEILKLKLKLNWETNTNVIEFVGIPDFDDDPKPLILNLAKTLGCNLEEDDVLATYRTGRGWRRQTVLLHLSNAAIKDKLLQAARIRRCITTDDLALRWKPTNPTPVYLCERTSRENCRLFKRALEEAKKFDWQYVWFTHGTVYVREVDDTPAYRIHKDEDLKIFNFGL